MRKKLLLADDSITIQKVVELTFPSDEFEVVTAGNGRIAVEKATTFLPDIVLCDVIMPQLDGYQVCEALRAMPDLQDVPILLLNGAFEPYDADRARSVGALGNVSKPFDPPALVSRVKEILTERASQAAQPIAADELAEFEPYDDSKTMDGGISELPLAHEFSYDDSETSPVSTMEVPWGVREMAARSLALDAPVFAPPTPEVLPPEVLPQESDFSETLHGSLDPTDEVLETAPMEMAAETIGETEPAAPILSTPLLSVEDFATLDTIEAVQSHDEAPTSEVAAPAIAAEEPMDFEVERSLPEESAIGLPTQPSAPAVLPTSDREPSGGEREFDPDELAAVPPASGLEPEASAFGEVLPDSPIEGTVPEVMSSSGGFEALESAALAEAVPEFAPVPDEAEAPPFPVSPVAAVDPEPKAPIVERNSFSGIFDLPEPEPPVAVPPSLGAQAAASASLPSAEIAVPVDMVQQIAQRVISQVSERVIREIAWDVIPGLAEKLVRAEIDRIKARAESERD